MAFKKMLHIKTSRPKKRLPLLLECLLCSDKFDVEAVSKKLYHIKTGICNACYKKGVASDARLWCIGKVQTAKRPGFHPDNLSCRLLCPDRLICKRFIKHNKELYNGS